MALDASWFDMGEPGRREFVGSIARLRSTGVHVILWSDHTRAEMEVLRRELDHSGPFVSESGAALFVPTGFFGATLAHTRTIPGYDVLEFGDRYEAVVARLHHAAHSQGIAIQPLSDMSIPDVAEQLRIPLFRARLAKLREYGEVFRVVDGGAASRERLCRALRSAGLTCQRWGSYERVSTLGDRALALEALCRLFRHLDGNPLVACVVSRQEDLHLLRHANVRVLLGQDLEPAAAAPFPHETCRIETSGLDGWLQAMSRLATEGSLDFPITFTG